MAIEDMIGAGIGFSPGSVKFVVTRGLTGSALVAGPYYVEAMGAHVPGSVCSQYHRPGTVAVFDHQPGAVATGVS